MMQMEYVAELVSKTNLCAGNDLLTFACQEIADQATPGQFVNVSCNQFLKRPFGVCKTDREAKTFTIGVREIGAGSKDIRSAPIGTTFSILGPLGKGFSFDGVQKIITVGGGTGIYPLLFVLEYAKTLGIPTICVNGFRSRQESFLRSECEQVSDVLLFSSDAGDLGLKGTVIDSLALLKEEDWKNAAVYTVGPEIMMRKVSAWAQEKHVSCQVSMEKRMACGIGICLVCTCKVNSKSDGNSFHHVRCCKEGPVMNASEVIW
jgi:dihydroorotate dehydrogenase electron transfer subunit